MGVFKLFSSSSYDKPVCRDRIVEVEKRVEVPVVLPNPDPTNYTIERGIEVGRFVLLEVNYPDCTNYEGRKLLVYEYATLEELNEQGHLDPHFAENQEYHSPIARFEPTEHGWNMAHKMVRDIQGEEDILDDGWRN